MHTAKLRCPWYNGYVVGNEHSDPSSNPRLSHRTNTLGKGMNPSRGARGIMVIVLGNGHGDTSSNPGPD